MSLIEMVGLVECNSNNIGFLQMKGYEDLEVGKSVEIAVEHLNEDFGGLVYEKTYEVGWMGRPSIRLHYTSRGYKLPAKKTLKFNVKPKDLSPRSHLEIMCLCDSCGNIHYPNFFKYKIYEELNEDLFCNCNVVRPLTKRLVFLKKAMEKGLFKVEETAKGINIQVQSTNGNYKSPSIRKDGMVFIPKLMERHNTELIKFVFKYPHETYSSDFLALCWFNRLFPEVKIDSFWNMEQIKECLKIIIENNTPLKLIEFRKEYSDLYNAISYLDNPKTGGKYTLLAFSRENDIGYNTVVEAYKISYKSTQDSGVKGTLLEQLIVDILLKYCKQGVLSNNFRLENCNFDLVDTNSEVFIDFKMNLETNIDKEVQKYAPIVGFDKIVCVYFYGPVIDFKEQGIRKVSIFKWLIENKELFTDIESVEIEISGILLKVKNDDSAISQLYSNRNEQIFFLYNQGLSQSKIGEIVKISRRQVGRILSGESVKEYTDKISIEQFHLEKEIANYNTLTRNKLIMSLHNNGYNSGTISKELLEKGIKLSSSRITEVIRETKVKELFKIHGKSKEFLAIKTDGTEVIKYTSTVEAAEKHNFRTYRDVLKCINGTSLQRKGYLFIPVSIMSREFLATRLDEIFPVFKEEKLSNLVGNILERVNTL